MRPIWTGAVSFGLIFFPVRLYKASERQELPFKLLRNGDLCPIRHKRVCAETGEEVPYENIVRGYEYEQGKYVVVEDEDFLRANVHKTQVIEIVNFVELSEIEPKFLERPYYLEPAPEGKRVYALLREALKQSRKAGLARFVLRTREHLAILTAEDDLILLNLLRFTSELRSPDDLELPEEEDLTVRELNLAVRLIEQLSEPWQPERFTDTYTQDLKRLIQKKIGGEEVEPTEEAAIPLEVPDLYVMLNESLQEAKKRPDGGG